MHFRQLQHTLYCFFVRINPLIRPIQCRFFNIADTGFVNRHAILGNHHQHICRHSSRFVQIYIRALFGWCNRSAVNQFQLIKHKFYFRLCLHQFRNFNSREITGFAGKHSDITGTQALITSEWKNAGCFPVSHRLFHFIHRYRQLFGNLLIIHPISRISQYD